MGLQVTCCPQSWAGVPSGSDHRADTNQQPGCARRSDTPRSMKPTQFDRIGTSEGERPDPGVGPALWGQTDLEFSPRSLGSDRFALFGPGRPGWLPTQVPHRSGLAHHAHPVPHLMNSRPARSVVGTWTWFRSRCTCQVSLQRLMRRHPLPSTGSLGLVPPLPRYYEVLRLPAAHFAALRFLGLAIPSLRPLFVPPGPGRGAVDQSGVGRRYLQPPCSMEEAGSPKFPEEPL